YLRQASPPRGIVLATGQERGMYDTYGLEYARRLGRLGLRVEIVRTHGAVENMRRVLARTADVGFTQAGTDPPLEDGRGVARAVAALYVEPLWIFYRSDVRLDGIAPLVGRTIAVGPSDSGTEAVALALLERHASGRASRILNMTFADAQRALEAGRLDAAFF